MIRVLNPEILKQIPVPVAKMKSRSGGVAGTRESLVLVLKTFGEEAEAICSRGEGTMRL